jgi:hypothetical protein
MPTTQVTQSFETLPDNYSAHRPGAEIQSKADPACRSMISDCRQSIEAGERGLNEERLSSKLD